MNILLFYLKFNTRGEIMKLRYPNFFSVICESARFETQETELVFDDIRASSIKSGDNLKIKLTSKSKLLLDVLCINWDLWWR